MRLPIFRNDPETLQRSFFENHGFKSDDRQAKRYDWKWNHRNKIGNVDYP